MIAQLVHPETGQSRAVTREHVTATWNRTEPSQPYYEVFSRMRAPPGRAAADRADGATRVSLIGPGDNLRARVPEQCDVQPGDHHGPVD